VPPPLVSVLLPVRDAEATLVRCLRSLAAQTLENHEVVAVDDGSTDGSGHILEQWAHTDARIRVVHTEPLGLSPALNRAAALARGPLLARMDADDVCAPHRLGAQWARLKEPPPVDILGSRVLFRGEGARNTEGMRAYTTWQNTLLEHAAIVRDLWIESPLVHPSVMMPASILSRLGGYRDFGGPEDYDLWLRGEGAGLRFAKHPECLLEWWDGGARLTRISPNYAAEALLRLKVEALERRHLPPGRPVVIWGAGPIGKSWARALRPRGHVLRAFVEVDRRKLGTTLYGAPVVSVGEAGELGPALHLAAVGQRGRREQIRAAARGMGLLDGRDLIAVA